MITVAQANRRVVEVIQAGYDCEKAHSLEDKLHREALNAIADGHPEARLLAAVVVQTDRGDFARYCA